MERKFSGWLWGLVLVGVFSLISTALAEVRYTITDLGTMGGNGSYAYGINNDGAVVGSASTASGESHATFWMNGSTVDLIPDRRLSVAGAINKSGQVVGFFENPEANAVRRAFSSDGTMVIDLGTLGGINSEAHDVNDSGQVVGFSQTQDGCFVSTEAFIWQDGAMTGLGSLGGGESYAFGINNKGEIAGYSFTADRQKHAFVWRENTMTDLGTLGGDWSEAYDINEASQIVGFSEVGNDFWHAFLYRNGAIQDLGTLGGDMSYAAAINENGQVVGCSDLIAGDDLGDLTDYRAYLWEDGRMIDLNTLIDENSDWILRYARDINDHGLIVGEGIINGETRAFMLTPVPEPMSLLFLLVGLAGLVRRQK